MQSVNETNKQANKNPSHVLRFTCLMKIIDYYEFESKRKGNTESVDNHTMLVSIVTSNIVLGDCLSS